MTVCFFFFLSICTQLGLYSSLPTLDPINFYPAGQKRLKVKFLNVNILLLLAWQFISLQIETFGLLVS